MFKFMSQRTSWVRCALVAFFVFASACSGDGEGEPDDQGKLLKNKPFPENSCESDYATSSLFGSWTIYRTNLEETVDVKQTMEFDPDRLTVKVVCSDRKKRVGVSVSSKIFIQDGQFTIGENQEAGIPLNDNFTCTAGLLSEIVYYSFEGKCLKLSDLRYNQTDVYLPARP